MLRLNARRAGVLAFVTVLLLHGSAAMLGPSRASSDTHTYSRWADEMLGAESGSTADASALGSIFYLGFIALAATVKTIFGSEWYRSIVVLNAVSHAATAGLVASLAFRVTGRTASAIVAPALIFVSVDLFGWTRYVLSDSTFVFLSFALFYLVALRATGARTTANTLALTVLSAAVIVYRPVGIVYATTLLGGWLFVGSRRWSGLRKRIALGMLVMATMVFVVASLVAAGALAGRGLPKIGRHVDRALDIYSARYRAGVIINDRPETFHAPPQSVTDYVAIAGDRFAHFFYCCTGAFSIGHNVANAVFFLPAYVLIVAGIAVSWRSRLVDHSETATIAALLVLVVALFHSATHLDFDWRYRAPALPHLAFLASVGAEALYSRAAAFRKRGRLAVAAPPSGQSAST